MVCVVEWKIDRVCGVGVIILVLLVDVDDLMWKWVIVGGGVFMGEMMVKWLCCKVERVGVKSDGWCDGRVMSVFGNEV